MVKGRQIYLAGRRFLVSWPYLSAVLDMRNQNCTILSGMLLVLGGFCFWSAFRYEGRVTSASNVGGTGLQVGKRGESETFMDSFKVIVKSLLRLGIFMYTMTCLFRTDFFVVLFLKAISTHICMHVLYPRCKRHVLENPVQLSKEIDSKVWANIQE